MTDKNEYNVVIATPFFNEEKGQPRKKIIIKDVASYKQLIKKKEIYCEIIGDENQIKPSFDVDYKFDEYELCKNPELRNDVIKKSNDILKAMFPNKEICMSEREARFVYEKETILDSKTGKEKENKKQFMKFSFRFYVQDCRISYKNIKTLLKKFKCENNDPFDDSIYTKNRILVLPFFKKPIDKVKDPNPTVLQPLYDGGNILENDNDIFKYCASYIQKDYEDLDKNFTYEDKALSYTKKHNGSDVHSEEGDKDIVFEKLKKYNEKLSNKRATDFDTWLRVNLTYINICKKHQINKRKCQELIHEFSKKSPKYNEDDVDDWIEKNFNNHWDVIKDREYGWTYLKETCLQEDDKDYYDKHVGKSYTMLLRKFEREVFKVMNPVGFIRVKEDELLDDNSSPIQLLRKTDLKTAYEEWVYWEYDEKKKTYIEKSFIDRFCKDMNKKIYERIIFQPQHLDSELSKQYYNLYKGIRAELLEPNYNYEKIQPILDHILVVMMDNNRKSYDYFIQYLANIIQNPMKKSGVIIVFQGKQGCGKNIIIDAFANGVLGNKLSISTSNPERVLLGNFNACSMNKILGVMNEMGSDIYNCIDKLKDLSTSPTMTLELKGKDAISVSNYINLIGTTNNTNPLDISIDDRRIVWFECNNEKVGDEAYFSHLIELLQNDECISAFYNYLKNEVKITINNFQKYRPITDAYKRIQKLNMPSYVRWIQEYNQNTELIYRKYKGEYNCVKSKTSIYKNYIDWCEDSKYIAIKKDTFFHHLTNKDTGITECLRDGIASVKINEVKFHKWLDTYNTTKNNIEIIENYYLDDEDDRLSKASTDE